MFSEDISRDSVGKIGLNIWLDFKRRLEKSRNFIIISKIYDTFKSYTTSDISRWNTLPSYPYSMLHGVVSACLHLFGWNYFTTLSCGRGRETQLYRQCFNKVTLIVSNGKDLNYVSRHTGLYTQTYFLKIDKYIWLGKGAWCFRRLLSYSKWREEKPNLSLRLKHRKPGLATDQNVPV